MIINIIQLYIDQSVFRIDGSVF